MSEMEELEKEVRELRTMVEHLFNERDLMMKGLCCAGVVTLGEDEEGRRVYYWDNPAAPEYLIKQREEAKKAMDAKVVPIRKGVFSGVDKNRG